MPNPHGGNPPQGHAFLTSVSSENSAHRVAVEWEDEGGAREGVFVPRRDTDSRLNAFAGGRIFPGVHHLSRFDVGDEGGRIALQVHTPDDEMPLVDLEVRESAQFQHGSVFKSLEESSRFFENRCVGYSSRPDSCILDGLLLQVPEWKVQALRVDHVRSAYFDDHSLFPSDSLEFDHALLMRDIQHEWHSEPEIYAGKKSSP